MSKIPVNGKRPANLSGVTVSKHTPCGSIYVTVNTLANGEPYEVRLNGMGKSGGCVRSMLEVIGTLASKSLEEKVPIDKVIKRFEGISCDRADPPVGNDPGGSCLHKISIGITEAIKEIGHES